MRLFALALLCSSSSVFAEGPKKTPNQAVENILDKLEQRLMDQDSEGLKFSAPAKGAAPEKKPADTVYEFSRPQVVAPIEQEKLTDLSKRLTDAENQIDQLSSDVQRSKNRILQDVRNDNTVSIEGIVNAAGKANLRMISVKLDGFEIYSGHEATGLWLPQNRIYLYHGPLQPGAHKLDLEARLVLKNGDAAELNNNVVKQISETFSIAVPTGKSRKQLQLVIEAPQDRDGDAKATLNEQKAANVER